MTLEIRSLGIKTLGLTTHGIRHYNWPVSFSLFNSFAQSATAVTVEM